MRVVRWALAVVLWAACAATFVFAWKLPMEAGGLLLGPILLGIGTAALFAGLSLVLPRRARRTRPRWWPEA